MRGTTPHIGAEPSVGPKTVVVGFPRVVVECLLALENFRTIIPKNWLEKKITRKQAIVKKEVERALQIEAADTFANGERRVPGSTSKSPPKYPPKSLLSFPGYGSLRYDNLLKKHTIKS